MEKIKTFLKENKIETLFIAVSILFGALFGFAIIAYDDATNVGIVGTTLKENILYNLGTYRTWTSRILINTGWSIIIGHGVFVYMLYMGVSMYVLLKALFLLFSGEKKYKRAVFTVFAVMLFPFHLLWSAGWIATTGTYFGPQAFGMMGLVPMRKIYDGVKITIKEMIWYSLCLIYAANFEQACVALLFLYGVFVLCMIFEKKIRWESFWFLGLCVASLVFILTCPGNWGRSDTENRLFETYGMLSFTDKIELATTRTLKWIYIDGTILTIVLFGMICAVVWKKYEDKGYRLISAIPFAVSVLLGPLNPLVGFLFPKTVKLNTDVDYYGAINVASRGVGIGLLQVFVFLALSLLVLICLFLINDTVLGLIMDISLVLIGVGTGAMMGLSPTIYASGGRTFSTLAFCIIILMLHIYSKNRKALKSSKIDLVYVEYGVILFSFLNLASLVMTQFYQ